MTSGEVVIHSTADISEHATIGSGTRIWHETQIREDVVLGEDCIVGKGVYIDFGVHIGRAVKIQNRASIYHGTSVGDCVFIGPHVVFTNDLRPRAINADGSVKRDDDWEVGETTVQYGASIGAGSIILPGLDIGRFALVGAGAVVTKNVPDYGIVVGNPARIVGYVCLCATKLNVEDAWASCPACGRKYRVNQTDAGHLHISTEENQL